MQISALGVLVEMNFVIDIDWITLTDVNRVLFLKPIQFEVVEGR